MQKLYTPSKLAREIGVSRQTIYNYLKKWPIPYILVDGRTFIAEQDWEQFFAERKVIRNGKQDEKQNGKQ